MKKTNVLEFCLSPDLGGLELFMVNCYKHFKTQTNCKIIVEKSKKLDQYLENEEKYYIKRNKLLPIIPAIKLAKYIDKHDIDIIHFHWTKDITTVVLAKVLSKKNPKLIQTRNMTMTRFKDDFYHKWLYKHIHTMHAVTYQVKEQLEKFIPKDIRPNIKVVYMGTNETKVDTNDLIRLRETYNITDEFVIGIVGRIHENKGQYLLIKALSQLKDLNIKVLIVGHTMDETYLNNLKNNVKNLKIEDKVIFTGFTKEVDVHMKLFDINVLATPLETFGLVVIEAMMNKVCMIATNKGGPLEIIDDNVDGLLFNRTSEDLALKIEQLYNNPIQKEKLAMAGYNKAKEKFDSKLQQKKLYTTICSVQ